MIWPFLLLGRPNQFTAAHDVAFRHDVMSGADGRSGMMFFADSEPALRREPASTAVRVFLSA